LSDKEGRQKQIKKRGVTTF